MRKSDTLQVSGKYYLKSPMNPFLRLSRSFFDCDLFLALLAASLYSLSFSPYNFSFCIWIVPLIWAKLIAQKNSGATFYLKIWLSSFIFWLWVSNWMYLPPLWTKVLWVLYSLLISFFIPLFVAVSRTALTWYRIPLWIIMPITWCGVEWTRKNLFFGGMSFSALEHTQYRNLILIQIADIFGEYGIGAFIVFVGSSLWCIISQLSNKDMTKNVVGYKFTLTILVGVVIAVYSYGVFCLSQPTPKENGIPIIIALLQGTDETLIENLNSLEMAKGNLFEIAYSASQFADVVVWPESVEIFPFFRASDDYTPDGWQGEPQERVRKMIADRQKIYAKPFHKLAEETQSIHIIGTETYFFTPKFMSRLISAIQCDPTLGVVDIYDKHSLGPFLEYDTFKLDSFYQLVPRKKYAHGTKTVPFILQPKDDSSKDFIACVNICFDGTFSEHVRKQVNYLGKKGYEPDVLINMSNFASFRCKTILDVYVASHVYRAIENRKPYLSAANSGYATWIDPQGRIIEQGETGKEMFIIASIHKNRSFSFYRLAGDWFPKCCACYNLLVIIFVIVRSCGVQSLSVLFRPT